MRNIAMAGGIVPWNDNTGKYLSADMDIDAVKITVSGGHVFLNQRQVGELITWLLQAQAELLQAQLNQRDKE